MKDLLRSRAWWLTLELRWTHHANQRTVERDIVQISRLPRCAHLLLTADKGHGMLSKWQLYQDGEPWVLVLITDVDIVNQEPVGLVITAYRGRPRQTERWDERRRRRDRRGMKSRQHFSAPLWCEDADADTF